MSASRRLAVWCPDWPVVAAARDAGGTPLAPAAVFSANRVLACSETARSSGVRRGMRRREAQGRCPELVVHEHDPSRDARLFEPVAAAVESLAPGVEIVRPGLVAVPARGPARYFGSEQAAAERVVDEVGDRAGVECQVGVADGLFTASLAARRGVVVEPVNSRGFLAPLLIEELDQPAQRGDADRSGLVDLLRRLGIRTLGEFAELPRGDVATRFGADAVLAHRAASGQEQRPAGRRPPAPDLAVSQELDPPVERVDAAAFAARTLAETLHSRLGELGLACTRLGVAAHTESGEELHRTWRCAEPLTPAGTADRVRWQLDGWLTGSHRPSSGIRVLSLHPEEVVGAGGLQLDLVRSATGESDDRAGRSFVRVQGMLGPDAVLTAVLGGGRDVWERARFVRWGDERRPDRDPEQPWAGRVPAPSPTVVPEDPWSAEVLDARGWPVVVEERHRLSGEPHRVVSGGGRSRAVVGWSGPWPLEQRWWRAAGEVPDPAPRVVVRMQVVLAEDPGESKEDSENPGGEPEKSNTAGSTSSVAGGVADAAGEVALLLVHEGSGWRIRGAYR